MVRWELMSLVTYEPRELPSHEEPAIVVIDMIHEKPNFRRFITYNLVFNCLEPSKNLLNLLFCINILLVKRVIQQK